MAQHEHPFVGTFLLGGVTIINLANYLRDVLRSPQNCACSEGPQHARIWLQNRYDDEAVDCLLEALESMGGDCDHHIVSRVAPVVAALSQRMLSAEVRIVEVAEVVDGPTPLDLLSAILEQEAADAAGPLD